MKEYWVMWTYSANYGNPRSVMANSPQEAKDKVVAYFSPDFQAKGNVFVFASPPVISIVRTKD